MNRAKTLEHPRRSVSVFFPILLIGAGVIWLLRNQGLIVQSPLQLFLLFWPVLLIVAGLEILLRGTGYIGTIVSAVLGAAVVVGAILFLTSPGAFALPSQMGWNFMPRSSQLQTADISQPLGDTRALNMKLQLPGGFGSIKPVTNPVNLMEGQVSYLGTLDHQVTRDGDTTDVILGNDTNKNTWLDFVLGIQRWDLRLNPQVPLALDLTIGGGNHDLDLREFTVKSIALHQGSGGVTLQLPQSRAHPIRMHLGSGIANLVLPKDMPARVNYDIGSGFLNVGTMRRVSGTNERGTYETEGFNQNGAYVIIDLNMGSGVVVIR